MQRFCLSAVLLALAVAVIPAAAHGQSRVKVSNSDCEAMSVQSSDGSTYSRAECNFYSPSTQFRFRRHVSITSCSIEKRPLADGTGYQRVQTCKHYRFVKRYFRTKRAQTTERHSRYEVVLGTVIVDPPPDRVVDHEDPPVCQEASACGGSDSPGDGAPSD